MSQRQAYTLRGHDLCASSYKIPAIAGQAPTGAPGGLVRILEAAPRKLKVPFRAVASEVRFWPLCLYLSARPTPSPNLSICSRSCGEMVKRVKPGKSLGAMSASSMVCGRRRTFASGRSATFARPSHSDPELSATASESRHSLQRKAVAHKLNVGFGSLPSCFARAVAPFASPRPARDRVASAN
jgi:hypothetical protein